MIGIRAGKMEPSCPLGTTRCIPQSKFHQKPYNKSFIDQVCSVKMAGYWPRSFLASLWASTSSRSINTQKKELGQYPAILAEQTWSITHTYLDLRTYAPQFTKRCLFSCFSCQSNLFSYGMFCKKTRFETEAQRNIHP